ncbi:hypothetical protein, partial [Bacillus mobilis]
KKKRRCDFMKTHEEMIKEVMDFQNNKLGFADFDESKTIEFCVQLVHEIFVQGKHEYTPQFVLDEIKKKGIE